MSLCSFIQKLNFNCGQKLMFKNNNPLKMYGYFETDLIYTPSQQLNLKGNSNCNPERNNN